jgi:hypothetical protein
MSANSLPNFFIVGAAKAGTTALAKYLAQHPDIFIPELKEPKYFSHPDNVFPHRGPGDELADAKVIKNFDRYQTLFRPGAQCTARGEASIDYLFFYETVSRRIHECVPDAVIFVILRNPVERAFSAYMHMIRDGREGLSFEEAIQAEPERRRNNWEFFWFYTAVGFYSAPLERYLRVFGKDRVFVFLYDDLIADPAELCKRMIEILGVDPCFIPDVSERHNLSGRPRVPFLQSLFRRKNIVKSMFRPLFRSTVRKAVQKNLARVNLRKETMRAETRGMLQSLYREDVLALEQILGRDLGQWIA